MYLIRIFFVAIFFISTAIQGQSRWTRQQLPFTSALLLSVEFTDRDQGCAGGWGWGTQFSGRACHTTNGGASWEQSSLPESTWSLISVRFVGGSTAYAAANKALVTGFASTSRIQPGTNRTDLLSDQRRLTGLVTPDAPMLIAPYRGMFMRSDDAGASWREYGRLPDSAEYLLGLSFPTFMTGYLTSIRSATGPAEGMILKTIDGGLNWRRLRIPGPVAELRNVCFQTATRGFAVGNRAVESQYGVGTTVGCILRTLDGGESWSITDVPGFTNVSDVNIVDTRVVLAVGARRDSLGNSWVGGICRSTDFGSTWETLDFGTGLLNFYTIRLSGEKGIALGVGVGQPDTSTGFLLTLPSLATTTDKGLTWTTRNPQEAHDGDLTLGLTMLDQNRIYISGGSPGDSGLMLHSTTGGGWIDDEPPVVSAAAPRLHNCFPNPFNPSTAIRYELPVEFHVRLEIVNPLGETVRTLLDAVQAPGIYQVDFDGAGLPSGVYFYRLRVPGASVTKKLVLMR